MPPTSNPLDPAQQESCPLVERLRRLSLDELKCSVIPGTTPIPASRARLPLEQHMRGLQQEFIGQSELLLYHAWLNVQLRRGIDVTESLERFRTLWQRHQALLLGQLNSRWLVSACDSICDHFPEPEERAAAMAAALFVKSIKLYETERLATLDPALLTAALSDPWGVPQILFDGLSAFRIGHGDMIQNLHQRVLSISDSVLFAGPILRELLRRMNAHDTVLKRCRDVHSNPATLWHY